MAQSQRKLTCSILRWKMSTYPKLNIDTLIRIMVPFAMILGTFTLTNKGNGKMLSVGAGELKFTDKECGEQTHWTWEQENFLWGTIRHKVALNK